MSPPVQIIAELGVNHNGDPALAADMLAAAAAAGADIIKLQTYRADEVMTAATPLAQYMIGRHGTPQSFLEMARRLQLPDNALRTLQEQAAGLGVELLSSPFDVQSVYLLAAAGMRRLKIPSGELVNPLMLAAAAETRLPLILSTGMADLEEVRWAVYYLARHGAGPVTLLHCLTQYPADFQHVNLRAMLTLKGAFALPIGYSDHTPGHEAAVAAVAMGAIMIEKHFTLDRELPGPDQHASLVPDEFAAMVRAIRNVEAALGDGVKRPAPPEMELRPIVRKSLVLNQAVAAGSVVTAAMLTAKRPGCGIPARDLDRILGRRLQQDVPSDRPLQEADLEQV